MSDTVVGGGDILSIANASWREGRQEYRGWQFITAVGQTKQTIEIEDGLRGKAKRIAKKDRQREAEHTVSVMLTHARGQSEERLNKVCAQAQALSASQNSDNPNLFAAAGQDLQDFASEVAALLNGQLSAGFGVFDPATLISLIMGIINAIKACKDALKPPVPAVI